MCEKKHSAVGNFLTSDTIDVQKLTVNPIKSFGETMYKTFLMALVLGFSTLNSADACPMADAAAFQEAAAKVAATEGAHASFVLNGMTCGSCSSTVAKHLNGVDGVLASAVDYQTGKVEVAFDSAKTDAKKLEVELVSTGYTLQKDS